MAKAKSAPRKATKKKPTAKKKTRAKIKTSGEATIAVTSLAPGVRVSQTTL